jgi:hypothetical protein
MFHLPPVDAVAPNPKTGEHVWLRGRRYNRAPLETAWLALAENDGSRMAALRAIYDEVRENHGDALSDYVNAAQGWTGNVVAGEVR